MMMLIPPHNHNHRRCRIRPRPPTQQLPVPPPLLVQLLLYSFLLLLLFAFFEFPFPALAAGPPGSGLPSVAATAGLLAEDGTDDVLFEDCKDKFIGSADDDEKEAAAAKVLRLVTETIAEIPVDLADAGDGSILLTLPFLLPILFYSSIPLAK